MRVKKKRTELESAENRYQALIEKRNELNNLGKGLRDERDLINERKRATVKLVQDLKAQRNKLVQIRKEHIKLRNHYQATAKGIIAKKKQSKKKIYPSLPREVEARKAELQMLDQRQQTTSLSLDKERELIETIKKKKVELEDIEKQLTEQSSLNVQVEEMDGNIDDLFRKGDEQHAHVVAHSEKIDKLHERMSGLVEELSVMSNEADKKHQQYLKIRERANKYHEKAQEMRKKVLAMKKEKDTDKREARKLIKEQNLETQRIFENKDVKDKYDDDALQELKKGKKIELS